MYLALCEKCYASIAQVHGEQEVFTVRPSGHCEFGDEPAAYLLNVSGRINGLQEDIMKVT